MKTLFLLLVLFTGSSLFAQQPFTRPVNRDSIEVQVSDSNSPYYYAKLIDRLKSFDITLTIEEYRLLYYGFVFQAGYSGYPDFKQKELNEAYKSKDLDLAVKICDTILTKYPVSLRANHNMFTTLSAAKASDDVINSYRDRYINLTNAVASSGEGTSCKTAFKTIFVADEYEIMFNYLGIKKYSGQSLSNLCDKFKVDSSEYYKSEELYFDTSETLLYMDRLFKKKK